MSKYMLLHNPDDCIGCQACEVHCKTNKNLDAGPAPTKIITIGPVMVNHRPRVRFVNMPCFHCEEPWCAKVCPTGAMQRRDADGIVFIQHSLCIGCKSCIVACPWGAPQWDPTMRKPVKCDYCKDRLDAGLQPACVTKCVTQCLSLVDASPLIDNRREKYAAFLAAGDALPGAVR
jgi:Fe-S-cluster-containing dehydrogenase component